MSLDPSNGGKRETVEDCEPDAQVSTASGGGHEVMNMDAEGNEGPELSNAQVARMDAQEHSSQESDVAEMEEDEKSRKEDLKVQPAELARAFEETDGHALQNNLDGSVGGRSQLSHDLRKRAGEDGDAATVLLVQEPHKSEQVETGSLCPSNTTEIYLRIADTVEGVVKPSGKSHEDTHASKPIVMLEKLSGGPIFCGNTISLRGSGGQHMSVHGETVSSQMPYGISPIQSLQIELVGSEDVDCRGVTQLETRRLLCHGDTVCLRACNGKFLQLIAPSLHAQPSLQLSATATSTADAQQWEVLVM